MKMNEKEKEKKLTCGPRDAFNVSWALFSFGLPVVILLSFCHAATVFHPQSTP
jgi:hypothetical protein